MAVTKNLTSPLTRLKARIRDGVNIKYDTDFLHCSIYSFYYHCSGKAWFTLNYATNDERDNKMYSVFVFILPNTFNDLSSHCIFTFSLVHVA